MTGRVEALALRARRWARARDWDEGAVLLALTWRREPLTYATAMTCLLAVAFALTEAEVRGMMRAAGWHGA
mgnify:CR=1 FL=1